MRKFLVEIQYNGKNYKGFQSILNGATIENKLIEAIEKLFNQKTEIAGCSRTDAGVSAESYFFDFATIVLYVFHVIWESLKISPGIPALYFAQW